MKLKKNEVIADRNADRLTVIKLKKNDFALVEFARKYPGRWQSHATDAANRNAVASCVAKGLIRTNEFHQFMAA